MWASVRTWWWWWLGRGKPPRQPGARPQSSTRRRPGKGVLTSGAIAASALNNYAAMDAWEARPGRATSGGT